MKNAQVSIEFMTFIGVAIFLLLIFTGVVVYYMNIAGKQQAAESAGGLLLTLKSEINTASMVENNYERKIRLPGQLDGKNYALAISNREVTISYGGNEYSEIVATNIAAGVNAGENDLKRFLKIAKKDNAISLALVNN